VRSSATNKISLFDMYVRFWRWASDRLRDDGVIAFVTNRNYIDKVAFDGFRKSIAEEFAECWIMDLGGDVRANPKISGTMHNVFGIQTGVAIGFMVRKKSAKGFKLFYARRPEDETAKDKLGFLASVQDFERWDVVPLKADLKGNWLSTDHPDWASFLPLADPSKGPSDRQGARVQAIFRLSSNGLKTQRDDWMWGREKRTLTRKVRYFIQAYRAALAKQQGRIGPIKWDRELDRYLKRRVQKQFEGGKLTRALYRPFTAEWVYFDAHLNGMTYRLPHLFHDGVTNPGIIVSDKGWRSEFSVLASEWLPDLHALATQDGFQVVTRYRHNSSGERLDNITDWALKQFNSRYEMRSPKLASTSAWAMAGLRRKSRFQTAQITGSASSPRPAPGPTRMVCRPSPRTRSSPIATPPFTIRYSGKSTPPTSAASSRASRCTTASPGGSIGGSDCSTCTSATRRPSRSSSRASIHPESLLRRRSYDRYRTRESS
jgi:predicted helicase